MVRRPIMKNVSNGNEKQPYVRPEVSTISSNRILQILGPAAALYGPSSGGGPIAP
jgi:hypothetical protein